METSVIFVLARAWRLRAGAVAVVMDNMHQVSGESGAFDPQEQLDHRQEHIERLAQLGNEIVATLFARDGKETK